MRKRVLDLVRGPDFRRGPVIVIVLAVVFVAGTVLRQPLSTLLRSGTTIRVEMAEDYNGRIHADRTKVKYGGLEVGVVSGVDYTSRGTAIFSLKVDDNVVHMLGPSPSVQVEPLTVLGSAYSVDLIPGGGRGSFDTSQVIPISRTSNPTELDRILAALPSLTRHSLQRTIVDVRATLNSSTQAALKKVVTDAPGTLAPAYGVLQAVRGENQNVDLANVVQNLQSVAHVLTSQQGQLGQIVDALGSVTQVLSSQAPQLSAALNGLPQTLQQTQTGMTALGGTLSELTDVSASLRPSVRALDPALAALDPLLTEARPVVHRLRPLLQDLRPTVQALVPVGANATTVLADVRGPVLDRIDGPILHMVLNTWRGTGAYAGSGGGFQAQHTFYQELGYLAANLDRASMTQDRQGASLNFQVGAGLSSVALGGTQAPGIAELLNLVGGRVR